MSTVLRIEHPKSGLGCYIHKYVDSQQAVEYEEMYRRHSTDDEHPNPFQDIGNSMQSNEFCGFADAEQLHNWFTDEELKMLFSLGFELIEVEAKNIRYGKRQVVFEKVG